MWSSTFHLDRCILATPIVQGILHPQRAAEEKFGRFKGMPCCDMEFAGEKTHGEIVKAYIVFLNLKKKTCNKNLRSKTPVLSTCGILFCVRKT